MRKLAFIIVIILLNPYLVHAYSSKEVIQKRIDEIYQICEGNDLLIKEGAIIDKNTQESLISVPWPWLKQDLGEIITILATGEPYRDYKNYKDDCSLGGNTFYVEIGDMLDGCHILQCGTHALDISDTKYFLDGIGINHPQDIQNIALNNTGNLVQGSSVKDITQNIDSTDGNYTQNVIVGLLVGLPLLAIEEYVRKKRKK